MEKNLKRKKFTVNKDDKSMGVFTISLVNEPAIEVDFQYFAKEKMKFQTLNEEKHIVLGPIMIPNFEILRYDAINEEYYYGIFDAETIKFVSEKYLIENLASSVNLEHSKRVADVSLVESWIVEDPQIDKAKVYGYDVAAGTWMGAMKINNQEVWDDYIKTGILKGFSVECALNVEDENDVAEDLNDDELIQQIKNLLSN